MTKTLIMNDSWKVAMFTDLHLGIHGNSEEWHNIAMEWCDWIVEDLKKRNINTIFFLGDFFDNRSEISVQTIHVASYIMDKFKDFSMIMIIGNHDAFYKNRADVHSLGLLGGHPNVQIIDENYILEARNKKLLFVPWNSEIPNEKFDYIFGHFEIQSFKMNNFKVCDHGLTPIDLLSKTDKVYSGHFHNRNSKKYNEGNIEYIGNTFPMDFSDVENIKGYHILNLDTGETEFIENTVSPKFKKIPLSKIKQATKKDITGNIVKLVVDLEIDDDKLDKIKIAIAKNSPHKFLVEFNVAKANIDSIDEIDSINLMDIFAEFIENLKLDEEQEKRIEAIIDNLYEKNNV